MKREADPFIEMPFNDPNGESPSIHNLALGKCYEN